MEQLSGGRRRGAGVGRTLKRMEHERQRALQRKMFEDQMRALEQQQAREVLCLTQARFGQIQLAGGGREGSIRKHLH